MPKSDMVITVKADQELSDTLQQVCDRLVALQAENAALRERVEALEARSDQHADDIVKLQST